MSSLFTREFYRFLGKHLDDRGILVQWIQTYELNDKLFYSMVAALIEEYPYVHAYLTNSADVIFIASYAPIRDYDVSRLQEMPLAADLKRAGLATAGDHQVRRFADRAVLKGLIELFDAPVHTDYLPSVALHAPRSRFKGESVLSVSTLMGVGMPVLEMTGGRRPVAVSAQVATTEASPAGEGPRQCAARA